MKIFITKSSVKELRSIPEVFKEKIETKIKSLITTPFPISYKKLSGRNGYRIRQGDYRILYKVDKNKKEIVILSIKHRRDAYKM